MIFSGIPAKNFARSSSAVSTISAAEMNSGTDSACRASSSPEGKIAPSTNPREVRMTTGSCHRITAQIASPHRSEMTRVTAMPARSPVWSPDGTRIAFKIGKAFGEIATIRPDGSDLKTVTVRPSGEWLSVTTPMWSPTGQHLAYRQLSFRKPVDFPADFDVFVAPADGRDPVNLTADVDTSLIPVGWR